MSPLPPLLVGVNATNNDSLDVVKGLGFQTFRTEIYPDAPADRLKVVLDAALLGGFAERVLVLLKLERPGTSLPLAYGHTQRVIRYAKEIGLGINLEPMNEPNLAGVPPKKAAEFTQLVAKVAFDEEGFEGKVFGGSVSNFTQKPLSYLADMGWGKLHPRLDAAGHRYPDRLDPSRPHPGFKSREAEWETFRSIVGGERLVAITEFGYHTALEKWGKWWWKGSIKLTDEGAGVRLVQDLEFYQRMGAYAAYSYQWNDGPTTHYLDRYGHRTPEGALKAQALIIKGWLLERGL